MKGVLSILGSIYSLSGVDTILTAKSYDLINLTLVHVLGKVRDISIDLREGKDSKVDQLRG